MNRTPGLGLVTLAVIAGLLSFMLGLLGFSNPRGQTAGKRALQGAGCRV
jgi:hypothetical protein